MSSDIETMERRRLRLLEGYLLGLVACLTLMIIRTVQRAVVAEPPPLGGSVLIGMVLSLVLCVSCVAAYGALASRIRRDPELAQALDNELVRSYFTRSRMVGFGAAAATALIFAFLSAFSPVFDDTVMTALTTVIVGLTGHHLAFYCRVRFS
jgi:drug/metabolite transporter (DMT)-like permease